MRPVPAKMPEKEEDRQTMAPTRSMDIIPPPSTMGARAGTGEWNPKTMMPRMSAGARCCTSAQSRAASTMLTAMLSLTGMRRKLHTRMDATGSSSQGEKVYRLVKAWAVAAAREPDVPVAMPSTRYSAPARRHGSRPERAMLCRFR